MKPQRHRSGRPTASRLVRPRDGIAALPDFGPVYLQVKGIGGGLGKAVSTFRPVSIDGLAFDPEAAAAFSLEALTAIHALPATPGSYFSGSLEFEFVDWPQGLALHLLPDRDESRHLTLEKFLSTVPARPVESDQLEAWRDEQRQPAPMCPCCHERARLRTRFPERHPVHAIFRDVLHQSIALDIRLSAGHADLAATFTPGRLEVREGHLVVSDAPALHALHLEMGRLHAMAIDTTRLDGCDYAVFRCFDSCGTATVEVLCEDASLAKRWREICETAS